jgi:capsular polysaccharide biosynthesis protein
VSGFGSGGDYEMSMPSIASGKLHWRLLGRAALRRVGRLLFRDALRRARVGSMLHRIAAYALTLGGRRAGVHAAVRRMTRFWRASTEHSLPIASGAPAPAVAAAPSYTSYKLEIDRTRVLQEMSLQELLSGDKEGFTFAVPEIHVDVKHHPLSVPSSNDEEARTYVDHKYRAPEMTLERLRDHYWFPEYGFLISKEGKVWRHSVLGQFGDPDFLTTYAVEKKSAELLFHEFLLHDCPVINETVAITSHYASHNYGHFTLDMAPLIHKLAGTGVPLISRPMLDWHKVIYRRLGIDPQSVGIVTNRAVFLKDVVVSNRHNAMGTYAASPQVREAFDVVLSNVRARLPGDGSKLVFVSRGSSLNREMRNRAQLAEALAKRGFTIVRPEMLSFDDQAATFAAADIIVSEFGAAMANVVFAKPRTTVVEIIPDNQNDPWSAHLCAALDLEHVTLFHRVDEADRTPFEIGGRILNQIYFKYDADVALVCRVVDALMAERSTHVDTESAPLT